MVAVLWASESSSPVRSGRGGGTPISGQVCRVPGRVIYPSGSQAGVVAGDMVTFLGC